MDAKRKALIAIGLVALWGGVAYWQWGTLPDPVRVPLVNTSGPVSSLARSISRTGGLRVHLEQLASARTQREATFTAPRNIFAASGLDGTLSASGDGSDSGQLNQASEEALQQQAASLELDQYRYLGFVRMGESTENSGNTAVLSKNEEVMISRVGQRLERHLVVKAITPESVTLRDTQARVDHTVPLTEDAAEPQP
ncbi:hypothetical protein [Nitrospira lenta]|uniref:Uncharacterized protein n=1 Tax=Nitrospira lenta TaxID=1436998 RepID=A0A330LB33_9BACT|nr:hypothetical protein [Nitrospira lenta]SPP66112.1 conserved hypothetical protein [Nitrospira lenta]